VLPIAILCGGLGTRLLPKTAALPKALIPVNGTPFIEHQLRLVHGRGVRRVVLCVGHFAELIEAAVGDGSAFGVAVSYSHDGPMRAGTGGAVRRALSLLGEAFLVMYGDSYLVTDYSAVEKVFEQSGKRGLMTVWRNRDRLSRSNVEMHDGSIVRYDKKAPVESMEYIDWGLSAFRSSAFDEFAKIETFDLGDVHRALLAEGQLAAFEVHERFYEVGSHEGLAQTESFLA
jgi:NDP-sugar pyrophosphorylase family protein